MPTSIMQKNYSNCPLKKRPIIHIVREELLKEEPSDLEPENLSTKPEDLSKTGKYPVTQLAQPLKTEVRTPSPLPIIVEPVATPTIQERRNHPISPIAIPIQPITPPSPAYTPPAYYPPLKSEPLNLNSNSNESLSYTSPTNWHKPIIAPTPTYHNYLPYPSYHHIPVGYENYGAMYHHVSPTRSEQLSPYNSSNRESSLSPPSQYHHHHHHQNNFLLNSPRDNSLSPPIPLPYSSRHSSVIKSDIHYQNTQHRYLPYQLNHHHHHHHQPQFMMPIDPSSLSPTSSHTSYNSIISSRRSLSPLSTSTSSTPEDLSNSSPNTSILLEKTNNIQPIIKSSVKKELTSDKLVNSGNINNSNSAPRYQCPDCGKSYSTYSGLSKHQQFHCPAAIGNQVKKSFSCKYCEKVYVSLGALKMHIRTHTLPCKCHTCGKAFSRPWLLQGHIRTHTGEKPFSCQHCHRAFADRSNLRAHLQTHSDVKKYSCTTCSKTFSRMSLLTKHNDGGCPGLLGNNNNSNSNNNNNNNNSNTLSQNSPQPKDCPVY